MVYGSLNHNPRVVLRAHGDVRLTVRGQDGTIYLNSMLKAGDSYQVPNMSGLNLATNDGGEVDAVVDGLDLGKVGQNQQVLGRVSLDPNSLVDRFNSR
jgi:cytoskeleton protein RodZ